MGREWVGGNQKERTSGTPAAPRGDCATVQAMTVQMRRRDVLVGLGVGALGWTIWPQVAQASTALAIDLPELVARSRQVCVARAVEKYSRWETFGEARRIVTYTRVLVEEPVTGADDSEVLVQTLGGKVGDLGQIVHGEAGLQVGKDDLLFLRENRDGVTIVTARAQGQFPVAADKEGVRRVLRNPRVADLVGDHKSAALRLVGRSLPDAIQLVRDVASAR